MKINKTFKLEELVSKDENRQILQSIYVYENGKQYAVATNGQALAKVPVTLEENELKRGNSVKAHNFKFQRQNPNIKKETEMFVFLEPLQGQYPNFEMIWPKEKPTVTLGLNVELLVSLSKALGTSIVQLEIIDSDKAIVVTNCKNKEAKGLIMPCSIKGD